jgi:endogenous inhibitor of DNA gyrase (YacG/DUF329 family)
MAAKCPLCSKASLEAFKPFCSKRCADLDLNQWFKGGYAIPGPAADPASLSNPSQTDPDED